MAMLWMDGEEVQFSTDDPGLWDSVDLDAVGHILYGGTVKRTGNGAVSFSCATAGKAAKIKALAASVFYGLYPTDFFVGFGVRFESSPAISGTSGNTLPILALFSSSGANQITIGIDATSKAIKVFRGGTNGTLLATGAIPLVANTMHYFEMHCIIGDVGGEVSTRLDGVADIAATGIDTNIADGNVKTIHLGIAGVSSAGDGGVGLVYVDDFVFMDGTIWPNRQAIYAMNDYNYHYGTMDSTGDWYARHLEVDDVTAYGGLPDSDTTMIYSSTVNSWYVLYANSTVVSNMVGVFVTGVMMSSCVSNTAGDTNQMRHIFQESDEGREPFLPVTFPIWGWHSDVVNDLQSEPLSIPNLYAFTFGWRRWS